MGCSSCLRLQWAGSVGGEKTKAPSPGLRENLEGKALVGEEQKLGGSDFREFHRNAYRFDSGLGLSLSSLLPLPCFPPNCSYESVSGLPPRVRGYAGGCGREFFEEKAGNKARKAITCSGPDRFFIWSYWGFLFPYFLEMGMGGSSGNNNPCFSFPCEFGRVCTWSKKGAVVG